jgi:hypothetical protein
LYQLDKLIAEQIRSCNCLFCGAVLHVAMYPRKPRGVSRGQLGKEYECRFSFCCKECRRRCTPPSVRFLGRKVYLGVMVVLAAAAAQGLTDQRYQKLVEHLPLSRYTLQRWLIWWQEQLPETPFWRKLQGRVPSISQAPLPAAILDLLAGDVLTRCQHLLVTLMPLTTQSCSHCPTVSAFAQKMSV